MLNPPSVDGYISGTFESLDTSSLNTILPLIEHSAYKIEEAGEEIPWFRK